MTNNSSSSSTNKTLPFHGRTTGPARRSTKGQWTAQEDDNLCKAVHRFKAKNWKKIAECFKDRTDVQCLHRWQKVLNPQLVKGPWTKEEDEELLQLVQQHGPKKWSTIAQRLPGRIGKQCRESKKYRMWAGMVANVLRTFGCKVYIYANTLATKTQDGMVFPVLVNLSILRDLEPDLIHGSAKRQTAA